MASGVLGQSAPSAGVATTVYTVPASTLSVVTISCVNRGTSAATVRIALASTATPTDQEYIEYGAVVPSAGVLERNGVALEAGKRVNVFSSSADTSFNVYGLEQTV